MSYSTITFSNLPPEILICLSKHMSPVSAASFALCNRLLSTSIGQKSWDILSQQPVEEQYTFMKLLTFDDPQYFACNICHKLHRCSKVQWPNASPIARQRYACPKKPEQFWPKNSLSQMHASDYRLHFTQIQLTIEGRMPIEAFRHTEVDIS